jgi:hypothetical protein
VQRCRHLGEARQHKALGADSSGERQRGSGNGAGEQELRG